MVNSNPDPRPDPAPDAAPDAGAGAPGAAALNVPLKFLPGLAWSAPAWIGAQLGGTLWMLLAAVAMGMHERSWAAVPLLAFAVANLAGWRLWRARRQMRARTGLQLLMLVELVTSAITLIAMDALGVFAADRDAGGNLGLRAYLYLLVFPTIVLWLWWIDRLMARHYAAFLAGKQRSGKTSGS